MSVRDHLLLLVICFAWGFNFVAVAQGMTQFSPWLFTALRFAILLLLLLPFLKRPAPDQWARLLVVAFSHGALHVGLLFWALQRSADVSSVAIVIQTYVPISVILAMVLLGERVGWRTGVAIGISFAGVVVLSFDPGMVTQLDVIVIAIGAATAQALASVLMRGLRNVGALGFQAWTALVSLPPMALGSLLFDENRMDMIASAGWLDWSAVLYSTLGASILGHGLFFLLVQRHTVSSIMPYLLLAPVLAVIFGILIWGDRPGWRLLAGGSLVLLGILVVTLRALHKAAARRSVGRAT